MALCDYFHHEISSDVYHQKIIILNFSFSFISIFAIKKIIASVPTSLFPFLGRQFIISYMHNETQSDYSIQFSSVTQSCPTLCDFMDCSMPGFSVHHQLPEFAQTHVHPWWTHHHESVMPSNHRILCCPLLLLPSIFCSIRVLSKESVLCIRWPKYWSFSFNISPSNEYSGLISFRMDWFELLAVQGTLKSFLQYHRSKASILWRLTFFIVQTEHSSN